MTNGEHHDPHRPSPSAGGRDSRLESFLRKAAPIIQSDRGLSEAGRIKLRALADELHLPPDLFNRGIEQLSRSFSQDQLTRSERHFVRYIRTFLSQIKHAILTTPLENKAIAIGTDKFQLPAERSRELVRRTASELGINRIARSDAEKHVQQTITEMVGYRLSISAEMQTRIHDLATNWSVSNDVAAEMLRQRLLINHRQRNRRRLRPMVFSIVVTAIVFGSVIAMIWVRHRSQTSGSPRVNKAPVDPPAEIAMPLPHPEWWSGELYQAAAAIHSSQPEIVAFLRDATSTSTDQRQLAYRSISSVEFPFSEVGQVGLTTEMAAQIVATEPSRSLRTATIESWLHAIQPPTERPATSDDWIIARQSLRLLRALAPWLATGESQSDPALVAAAQSTAEVSLESMQADFLHHLAATVWSDPATVAELVASPSFLEGFQPTANWSDITFSILEVDAGQWEKLQGIIAKLIGAADTPELVAWMRWIDPQVDPKLARWLANEIGARVKVDVSPSDIAEVRRRLLDTLAPKTPEQERREQQWIRLQSRQQQLAESHSQRDLQNAANQTFLATLAFDLWLAEQRPNQEDPSRFEEWLDAGVVSLRGDSSNGVDGGVLIGHTARPPNSVEREALASHLARLADPNTTAAMAAVSNKKLAELAGKFSDISYSDAQVIIRHWIRADEGDLWDVEQSAIAMRHWPTLVLALLDDRQQARGAERGRATDLLEILLPRKPIRASSPAEVDGVPKWVLEYLTDELSRTIDASDGDGSNAWRRLESHVTQNFRHRVLSLCALGPPVPAGLDDWRLPRLQAWLVANSARLLLASPEDLETVRRKQQFADRYFDNAVDRFLYLEDLWGHILDSASAGIGISDSLDDRTLPSNRVDQLIEVESRLYQRLSSVRAP